MIKKTILILLFYILASSIQMFGAACYADFLLIGKDTMRLSSTPIDLHAQSIEQFFRIEPHNCIFSYWRLENKRLYLVEIMECNNKSNTADLSLIFGNNFKKGRVFADWVSGELIYPYGKWIDFPGISTSESEEVFFFSKGSFIKKYEFDNSKSFKSFFTQNTDSLLSFIYSNINWEVLPGIDDSEKKVALRIMSGDEKCKFQILLIRGIDKVYNNEALRVARLIPEWDVLYIHGQPKKMDWLLPIDFSNEMKLKYKRE